MNVLVWLLLLLIPALALAIYIATRRGAPPTPAPSPTPPAPTPPAPTLPAPTPPPPPRAPFLDIDILEPDGTGPARPDVVVRYLLRGTPAAAGITVEYSADGGATFLPATELSGGASEGVTGLRVSLAGEQHTFVWDSVADTSVHSNQDVILRMTAVDGALTDQAQTPPFDTALALPPSVRIVHVRSNRTDPTVALTYELTDAQPGLSRVRVEYSEDGGQTWSAAHEAPNLGSEGVIGLSTSTAGDRHTFVWAAVQDLGRNQATGLLLKIEALDTRAGGMAVSSPFSLGVNTAPVVTFLAPRGGTVRSTVMVRCLVQDPDADLANIALSFSVDGGLTFRPITPSSDRWSEPWTDLDTSPDGEAHLFGWDATTDVGSQRRRVILRAEAADANRGAAADSQPFDVDSTSSSSAVQIINPVSGTYGPLVPFQYRLVGQGPFDVAIPFSLDGGLTFRPGTPDVSISDPVTGLTGGPSGQTYVVFWNAAVDLAGLSVVDDVYVRVEATDAQQVTFDDTAGPIDVHVNLSPSVQISSPGGNQVPAPVHINYVLKDFENDFISVDIQWSTDHGVTFHPAAGMTSSPLHEGTQNLSSSFSGDSHVFVWDSVADTSQQTLTDVLVRIEPRDPRRGPATVSQRFDIVPAAAPAVALHAPGPGVIGTPVPLLYTVSYGGGLVDAVVEYSIGGGAYQPATEAVNAGSEGLAGLSTSVVGTTHFFAWDFDADAAVAFAANVRLRLSVRSPNGTTTIETQPLTVDATRSGVPCSRGSSGPVSPPEVQVMHGTLHPASAPGRSWTPTLNHFPVQFFVSQSRNERCNVAIEYRDAQGHFQPITPADRSDDLTNLAAPYHARAGYTVLWNVLADLGTGTHHTVVRVTPYIGATKGPADTTVPLQITVPGIVPLPAVPSSTAPSGVAIEKVDGDRQIGIAGLLMPKVLKVRIKESGNLNLTGARVTFAVVRSTGPDPADVALEPDFDLADTTNRDGLAGVRVRAAAAAAAYSVEVSARVVGCPAVSETFTLEVRPGVFVPSPSNPTTLAYGQPATFIHHLVADPNTINRLDFLPDADNPVLVNIAAVNGELSHSMVRVPGSNAFASNQFSFQVIPNLLGSPAPSVTSTDAVQISLSSPAIPSPWSRRIPIATPYNSGHFAGAGGSSWNDVRLHLDLTSGLEPPLPGAPQVAYGGITLTRKFRVELKDDAGNSYTRTINSYDQFLCILGTIAIPTQELEVIWIASGGTLRGGSQSGPTITAPISADVEFTPEGAGPWQLTARIDAVVRERSRQWTYTTSSGGTQCSRAQHGLTARTSRAVFVQRSPAITLLDAAAATRTPLNQALPGQRCRVEVSGLSDFRVAGPLEPIEVETTRLDGRAIAVVTGYAHEFKQDLRLSGGPSGTLVSAPFTLVRGEPSPSPSATHAVIRNAWLRLQFYDVVFAVPTERRRMRRERFKAAATSLQPDLASSYESPAGTGAMSGILATVSVHNGEFLYSTCDLSFRTRSGALEVCRTYRGHAQADGDDHTALGPGWFLAWDEHIDISMLWHRWQTANGRTVDFTAGGGDPADRGCFHELRRGTTLDNDNSPYVLVNGSGDETHFHVDGTLRFARDRHGNRFDFQYNVRGELERVYDCMTRDRYFALEYFHGTGSSQDPREGRLVKIADYTQRRAVDLSYFTAPANKAGLLHEVEYPSVPTLQGGAVQSSRRPERYDYVLDAVAGVWRLEQVLDADNTTLVKNEYQDGRVSKQSHETSPQPWQFAYDVAARRTTVSDGEGRSTAYSFPVSPFWDHVAPSEVVAAGLVTTTLHHNRDGLLTQAAPPDGTSVTYGYQEFVPNTSPPVLSAARSRGNLLRVIETAGGGERVSDFSYTLDNQLLFSTGPRGTAPGADPYIHRIQYHWDRQARTLQQIFYPPVLSTSTHEIDPSVTAAFTPPRPQAWYLHGWRSRQLQYTPDGRLAKSTDLAGVVTKYLYYPTSDWNGAGGSLPTESGGGLLGRIITDAESNGERDLQLRGVPLANQTIELRYDPLGNPGEMTDPRGIAHSLMVNDAHEVEELIEASRGPAAGTAIQAARRKLTFENDLHGMASKVRQEEPPVPAGEGGAEIFSATFDHFGLRSSTSAAVTSSHQVGSEVVRDGNASIETLRPPGSGQFPGSSATVSRDARGFIEKVESGSTPRTTSASVHNDGCIESLTFAGGLLQNHHFDAFRALSGLVRPSGHTLRVMYDRFGLPTRLVRYHVAAGGNPGRQLQPSNAIVGAFEERRYDEHGRLIRVHAGLFRPGAVVARSASQHIKKVADYLEPVQEEWPPVSLTDLEDGIWGSCDGRVTTDYSYDTRGLLTRIADDNGAVLMLRRDGLGRVIQSTWESGRHVVTYSYDDNGNPLTTALRIAFASSGGTQYRTLTSEARYDARNRPYESTDGSGKTIATAYSARDAVETVIDGRGHTATLTSDGLGRQTAVALPVAGNPFVPGGVVSRQWQYYDSGAVRSATDAAGHATEWEYDGEGRLAAIKYPGSQASGGQETRTRITYQPASGAVDSTEDAENTRISFEYVDGRLHKQSVTAPATPNGSKELVFEYDGDNRLVSAEDATTAHLVRLEYDTIGELVRSRQGSYDVSYLRQADPRRRTIVHPGPAVFEATYSADRQGRMTHIRAAGRVVCRFEYRFPTLVRKRIQGGITTEYQHNDNALMENATTTGLSSAADLQFVLTRDGNGRMDTCSRSHGTITVTWAWQYDELGHITQETRTTDRSGAIEEVTTIRTFDGDDVLRREQVRVRSGSTVLSDVIVERTREERGRILSETNAPPLAYDRNGSLVRFGADQFEYDSWRRLIRVRRGGTAIADYQYDALHRLIRRMTPESVEEYIYDNWHLIEVRRNGEVAERYVYSGAADDVVFAQVGGDEYHVLSDPMGNTHALVNAQGQLVQSFRYTLRGQCEVLDSAYAVVAQPPAVRLLFKHRAFDSVTGLVYCRARWYHPGLGSFLTDDPAGRDAGTDHYGLTHGDPVNFADPHGFQEEETNSGDLADLIGSYQAREREDILRRAVNARTCMDCHGDPRILRAGIMPYEMPWFQGEHYEMAAKIIVIGGLVLVSVYVGGAFFVYRVAPAFIRSSNSAFFKATVKTGFAVTGGATALGVDGMILQLVTPPPPPAPDGPSFNTPPTFIRLSPQQFHQLAQSTLIMAFPGRGDFSHVRADPFNLTRPQVTLRQFPLGPPSRVLGEVFTRWAEARGYRHMSAIRVRNEQGEWVGVRPSAANYNERHPMLEVAFATGAREATFGQSSGGPRHHGEIAPFYYAPGAHFRTSPGGAGRPRPYSFQDLLYVMPGRPAPICNCGAAKAIDMLAGRGSELSDIAVFPLYLKDGRPAAACDSCRGFWGARGLKFRRWDQWEEESQ